MIRKKYFLFTLFLFNQLLSNAQHVTVSSGGDAFGNGGKVSYSIGQAVYNAVSSSVGNINEGVQQPYEILIVKNFEQAIDISLSVYPNPTTNQIFIKINSPIENYSYQITDILGNLISLGNIKDERQIEGLSVLTTGTYFLNIYDNKRIIKTFKIIKK
jgi:hypothetical protein